MARPLRINYEGAFHHITVRGNERKRIFLSKADNEKFLSLVKEASDRYGVIVHCYALMGNHYHLAMETPKGLLSRFMHDINSPFTTYFNVKRKRSGHLFQGRFKSLLIDRDAYLLQLSRYIHLNPVRAGLVERPDDFPYSSYRAYVFPEEPSLVSRDLIWGMVAPNGHEAPLAYRRFVEKAGGDAANPFEQVYGGMILGNTHFVRQSLERIEKESLAKRETSRKSLLAAVPPALDDIIKHLASRYGVSKETVSVSTPYKHFAVYLARTLTPLSNADIGCPFGIGPSAVTKIVTRLTLRMERDARIRKELMQLRNGLSFVNG